MPLPEDLERQFEEQVHLGLLLHPDSRVTATYYRDGQMLLAGDLRELPPLILFRDRTIWVSGNGEEWIDATAGAEATALYALLDPRRVLRAAAGVEGNVVTVDVRQILVDAGQSPEGPEVEGQQQVVELKTTDDGVVTEMVQSDIGEPASFVTVRFIPTFDVTLPQ